MKFMLVVLVGVLFVMVGQDTGVQAEAVGQANLRAVPSVDGDLVGQIVVGTRYPVIGQSELYPWVLLGEVGTFAPKGWVFRDLVTVYGNLALVPISTLDVNQSSALPTQSDPQVAALGGNSSPQQPTMMPTPTEIFVVSGLVNGEINIRYGPGVQYGIVGRGFAGERFEITAYHTQLPWLQVRFDASPNGFAWIATDLLEVTGDIYTTEAIIQVNLNLPTLTPTASVLQSSNPLGEEGVAISPQFVELGERIWNQVLDAGFVPESRRFGALYIQDLQTGEAVTFGRDIAFSGTSINKIAILVEYFGLLDGTPNLDEAVDIANTMICSENVATNRLLGITGGGDQILGAENTTLFLQQLGMERTFLTAPFDARVSPDIQPTPPPRPIRAPETVADQERANPNPTNQMTVEEMGWLLSSVYQCAYRESGPLISQFADRFTPQECRKILHVMGNNTVDALLKAGVPADVRVAHKHGWIEDTHGNAAVMFTLGGDYVMVMLLHEPNFLQYTISLPVIAEASRSVYNYYNPDQPLEAVRDGYIPATDECNYTADDQLVVDLASPIFAETLESSQFYNSSD